MTKVVKSTVNQFFGSKLWVRYFWKWGNIRKRMSWNRRLRFLRTLWIGVSRKFHLHFTLMFHLRYYKLVRSLGMQKLISKITGIWPTSDKQWKVQKSWNLMGFCPKKYIPSAKTLYKVDLSNITFNYLCVDSPNYLFHFWNHKPFFTTQLLCIFLAQTLHTFH